MTVIERLPSTLGGLTAVEARLEALVERASKGEPSYADFLLEVLGTEVEARRARYRLDSRWGRWRVGRPTWGSEGLTARLRSASRPGPMVRYGVNLSR